MEKRFPGDEVRALRLHFGESQEAFALRFRVARNTVSVWESDGVVDSPAALLLEQLRASIKGGKRANGTLDGRG